MGTHNVTIHGVNVTAHVVDSKAAADKHIPTFRYHLQSTTKVVGTDIKKLVFNRAGIRYDRASTLILCVFGRCLIIHLDCICRNGKVHSLEDLLSDPRICFVGIKTWTYSFLNPSDYKGVAAGELAARVLKNPPLIKWSLSKVGVPYKGSLTQTTDLEVDSDNPFVFSDDDHVIAAASDAYANFQIGFMLLNSLPTSDA
ncbi:unnamed protein product [Amaranthus hypochondriacus]